jgi:hypothetical protein
MDHGRVHIHADRPIHACMHVARTHGDYRGEEGVQPSRNSPVRRRRSTVPTQTQSVLGFQPARPTHGRARRSLAKGDGSPFRMQVLPS